MLSIILQLADLLVQFLRLAEHFDLLVQVAILL